MYQWLPTFMDWLTLNQKVELTANTNDIPCDEGQK